MVRSRACLLLLVACCAVGVPRQVHPDAGTASPLALEAVTIDPALRTMLRHRAERDPEHRSLFFAALLSLARAHGGSRDDYLPHKDISEGCAVEIRAAQQRYVVAILRSYSHMIPGTDTQHLVLLGHDGLALDRLSFYLGSGFSQGLWGPGTYDTEVLARSAPDGTRLVIRYLPPAGKPFPWYWDYGIVHAGRGQGFGWRTPPGEPLRPVENRVPVRPRDLERQGLCRVTVRDGKLVVLFPKGGTRNANCRQRRVGGSHVRPDASLILGQLRGLRPDGLRPGRIAPGD